MNNIACHYQHVPYSDTGYFSRLVTDYLAGAPELQQFFAFSPDKEGVRQAIAARSAHPVNRQVLVSTLERQYATLPKHDTAAANIQSLLSDNTYTICTAHQPNLMTGYLYFIYKILHAIRLAEELNEEYPDKHFVPVYYMGSEDNDLDELGTFRFRGDKYVWDGDGQKGAVGRMNTAGLKKLFADLFKVFGPPGRTCEELQEMVTTAYLKHKTVAAATHYLVNALFGRYGLVVINPDEPALKSLFTPVMGDDLLNSTAHKIVTGQIRKLGEHYKIQAHPREINLFYLNEQVRERIEKQGTEWAILETSIKWAQPELQQELQAHPERFSPNVVLRGLYQERILPNVAFIGGGAEVAYWLQLKTLFDHYKIFYPAILLRQSVLWVDAQSAALQQQLELDTAELFMDIDPLYRTYISRHTDNSEWTTAQEHQDINAIFEQLKSKAAKLDPTLESAAEAALKKMAYQLEVLEKKMLKAEKKKLTVPLQRITKLRAKLFPNNSLQERVENFAEYYLEYGSCYLDALKDGIQPLGNQFLIVTEKSR